MTPKAFVELPKLLTPQEAAEYLRRPPETLRKWRQRGQGPKFVKLGASVLYTIEAIQDWIEESTITPGGSASR